MQLEKFPLSETRAFSRFFLDYLQQDVNLQPFFHRFPTVENAGEQIKEKAASFPAAHRDILNKTLTKQYQAVEAADNVKANIEALARPDTFTVTTGHQLNIFTGPLYFVYKIVTVINACKALTARYPEYHFVPVYWMASEDHDYDEIKSFRLYGKKYTWNTDQRGAVGRFHTGDFKALLNEIPGDVALFRTAYLKHKTLSEAVRYYVNALFGDEGLVVLDADDPALKALFKPVISGDILNHSTLPAVEGTNNSLETLGYQTQVYCRPVNFFYLDDQLRARIENTDGKYEVIDSPLAFSRNEIEALIDRSPEKFSPNVILRPLYQEWILPNLAYVGGPSEVTYWLQLKAVFDAHGVPFPMLMPRNFGLVIEHHIYRKFEKTGMELSRLFEEKNFLFNEWVLKHANHNLTVGEERTTISGIYEDLAGRATSIDPTLTAFANAEGKRIMNSLEKIEKKFIRAEKRKQSDKLRQIEAVKDALFPNGGLQERTDNFLNFYQQDGAFIAKLLKHFDPFDYRFNVLIY